MVVLIYLHEHEKIVNEFKRQSQLVKKDEFLNEHKIVSIGNMVLSEKSLYNSTCYINLRKVVWKGKKNILDHYVTSTETGS